MTFDPKELRAAFGRYLTGVTVVTTRDASGVPAGFTANSFTSVSLDPPLVLVCPGNHLSSFETFQAASHFGISVLSEGQEAVSNLFASRGGDRFEQCEWTGTREGPPLITGRAAGFVCETFQRVDAGDHLVLIGRVLQFDSADNPGLGYGPNGYFTQGNERKAEAPNAWRTRASVLLDDGQNLFLTDDLDLPTVDVGVGESPLRVLMSDLEARNIKTRLNVVYAVYDEGKSGRRIVFRGQTASAPQGLGAYEISALSEFRFQDMALQSLLQRFATEHKAQSFGFYIGNDREGDVMPAIEG